MAPKRRGSNTLNSSQLSNNSKKSDKSNQRSSASKTKVQREDSIEVRRKRLQKRVREDEPVIRTGKAQPGDNVRKIDEELEEIDAKFNRLKLLMKKTGENPHLTPF